MSFSVRPTPAGAALLGASAAAAAAGALRQELGALLWGAAFLGLGLYAFLTVLLGSLRVRPLLPTLSSHPRPFDGETGFPGTPLTSSWPLPLPLRLFPGLFLQGEVRARRPGREMRALTLLSPGKTAEISFPDPQRGVYRVFMILHGRDALGLFSSSLVLPGEGGLTVFPPAVSPREGPELPSLGGGGPAEQRSLRRSEELFDLRKYQPGDDPRRVHWKLFAHLEELFIRQGEEEPPPSGEYPVFLDLSRFGPATPDRRKSAGSAPGRGEVMIPQDGLNKVSPLPDFTETFLDLLLGRFALWGQEILRRGGILTLHGAGSPQQFRAGQEPELLSFLSSLHFQPPGPAVLPEETLRFYYLVTPYAPDWASRFRRLQEGGGARIGYLVIPAFPELENPRTPARLPGLAGLGERLLFCRDGSEGFSRQEADLLRRGERLRREVSQAGPRGGVHVL